MPDPVPTRVEPAIAPVPAPSSSGNLSPDGFDTAQRIAVRIRNIGCGALSTGSGFAIDDHTVITNRHVVADTSTLQVSTYDGRDLTADQASTAGLADLAIVRTTDTLPAAPELADADAADRRRRDRRRLSPGQGADRDARARRGAARPIR